MPTNIAVGADDAVEDDDSEESVGKKCTCCGKEAREMTVFRCVSP